MKTVTTRAPADLSFSHLSMSASIQPPLGAEILLNAPVSRGVRTDPRRLPSHKRASPRRSAVKGWLPVRSARLAPWLACEAPARDADEAMTGHFRKCQPANNREAARTAREPNRHSHAAGAPDNAHAGIGSPPGKAARQVPWCAVVRARAERTTPRPGCFGTTVAGMQADQSRQFRMNPPSRPSPRARRSRALGTCRTRAR